MGETNKRFEFLLIEEFPLHKSENTVYFSHKNVSSQNRLNISKHYRRSLVLWKGTCAPKAQKPVTLS